MFLRYVVILIALSASVMSFAGKSLEARIPERASGTFAQSKTLSDLGISLDTKGRFSFVKNKELVWETQEPIRSVFKATPKGYSFSSKDAVKETKLEDVKMPPALRGALVGDFKSLEESFETSESGRRILFVPKTREIKSVIEYFSIEGDALPDMFTMKYANGDLLEITFTYDKQVDNEQKRQ